MRAMQFFKPDQIENNPLQLVEVEEPQPGVGEIRVNIIMSGVCHTDLHIVEGDIHPPNLPIIPGHQVVGKVDKVGENVRNINSGDRVGVPWLYRACGHCHYCLRDEENLCNNALFTGFDVNGGFAEYMIADAEYVIPIPDEISDEEAAPLLCAGIIGYRSLHKADLKKGERLGLVGFGASAHLAIQVARYWECEVFVFTRSEEHRRHASELGAKWVGGAEDNPPDELDRAVIFAPAGHLVPKLLKKLRKGGTLAINAIYMSPIPEIPYELIYGERTLRSVTNATYKDGVDFMNIAAEIPVKATTTLYALEDVNKALADIKHSRINGEAVLQVASG